MESHDSPLRQKEVLESTARLLDETARVLEDLKGSQLACARLVQKTRASLSLSYATLRSAPQPHVMTTTPQPPAAGPPAQP